MLEIVDTSLKFIPDGYITVWHWFAEHIPSFYAQLINVGTVSEFRLVIILHEAILQLTEKNHPSFHIWFFYLGLYLFQLYSKEGGMEHIIRSIFLHQASVFSPPPWNHSTVPTMLAQYSIPFYILFKKTGNLHELDTAISIQEEAVNTNTEQDPNILKMLKNLGLYIQTRWVKLDDIQDLNKLIGLQEKIFQITSDNDPNISQELRNLEILLQTRFERLHQFGDLHALLGLQKTALGFIAEDFPNLLNILDSIIMIQKNTLHIATDDNFHLNTRLTSVGKDLIKKIDEIGNKKGLEKVLCIQIEALKSVMNNNSHYIELLYELRHTLRGCFSIADTSLEAKTSCEYIFENCPMERDSLFHFKLGLLGAVFRFKYIHTRDFNDLNWAILFIEHSINYITRGNPEFPAFLYILNLGLYERLALLGTSDDIDKMINNQREIVALTNHDSPLLSTRLHILSSFLSIRFTRRKNLTDLSETIAMQRLAIRSTSTDNSDYPTMLNNLSVAIYALFEKTGKTSTLELAIRIIEQAMKREPKDTLHLTVIPTNMGSFL